MNSYIKIPLLLLAAFAQRKGVKPPNPPPSKDDVVVKKTTFEKNPRLIGMFAQYSVVTCFITECVILLLLKIPGTRSSSTAGTRVLSTLCPGVSISEPDPSKISTSFILGITMMFASASLRVWCYNSLGRLFTYEVTIRPEHKLVTWGPYAYVRHPSYTASIFLIVGAGLIGWNENGYIRECRIMETPGLARWIVGAWIPFQVYIIKFLLGRGPIEDEILREEFGKSWEEYSKKVPCRFIPGII